MRVVVCCLMLGLGLMGVYALLLLGIGLVCCYGLLFGFGIDDKEGLEKNR